MRIVKSIFLDTSGASAVEYGIFIAAIAISALVSMNLFSQSLNDTFHTLSASMHSSN